MRRSTPTVATTLVLASLLVVTVVAAGAAGLSAGHPPGSDAESAVQSEQQAQNETVIDIDTERVNILLRASERTVGPDESVILQLSAVSYATNDRSVTVQLIVEAPSGVDVSSTTAAQGEAQYTATTTLNPGESMSTRVYLVPKSPGNYTVTSETVYFLGDDKDSGEGRRRSIQIRQEEPPRSASDWGIAALVLSGCGLLSGLFVFSGGRLSRVTNTTGEGILITLIFLIPCSVLFVSLLLFVLTPSDRITSDTFTGMLTIIGAAEVVLGLVFATVGSIRSYLAILLWLTMGSILSVVSLFTVSSFL